MGSVSEVPTHSFLTVLRLEAPRTRRACGLKAPPAAATFREWAYWPAPPTPGETVQG
jgi:hypothetical protein